MVEPRTPNQDGHSLKYESFNVIFVECKSMCTVKCKLDMLLDLQK
jgi:hypothetical protein